MLPLVSPYNSNKYIFFCNCAILFMPMTLTFLSNKIRNYFYIFLVPTLITLGIKITPNTIFF